MGAFHWDAEVTGSDFEEISDTTIKESVREFLRFRIMIRLMGELMNSFWSASSSILFPIP